MKIRKSLALTQEQWEVLDNLAQQTNSLITKTKWRGRYSWRKMLERVTDNDLAIIVQSKKEEVSSLLAGIKALEEE